MSDRTEQERINDMVQYSREAIATLGNVNFAEFCDDRQRHLAILYLVAVVGEAVSKSDAAVLRQRFPTIPWHEIRGIRNRIVHGYYNVKMEIEYEVVVEHLPRLIAALETTTINPQGGQPL